MIDFGGKTSLEILLNMKNYRFWVSKNAEKGVLLGKVCRTHFPILIEAGWSLL